MKTVDVLKQVLIRAGDKPAKVTPSLEGLCGIIDRSNRRIDALEKRLKIMDDE